jgi:hypothetical protein
LEEIIGERGSVVKRRQQAEARGLQTTDQFEAVKATQCCSDDKKRLSLAGSPYWTSFELSPN